MTELLKRREFFKKGPSRPGPGSRNSCFFQKISPRSLGATRGPSGSGRGHGKRHPQKHPQAVELLGGMKAFVPKGARVALLPNVQSRNPGHSPSPKSFGP